MSTDTPRRKIAFLITKSNWGGAQKHVYDIATHLDPKRYDVTVILGGHGMLKTKLSEVNIPTISIDSMERDISIKKEILVLIDIFKVLKVLKPDVLHVHSPKAAGIGSFLGRILGIKQIVYTIHGWSFNEDRSLAQKTIIVFFSWLTTIFAKSVVMISKRDMDQTLQFPFIGNKVSYIPIGIREQFSHRETSAREFLQKKIGMSLKDRFVVGMIGELTKNKGYTYAIEAMRELIKEFPDVVLTIIGSGEEEDRLKKMVTKLDLEQHVFFLGFVEQAASYAKAFDVLLMSSVKEGLPFVLLEAGSLGVPLVATTVGGIPEIIDDMRSGILIQPKKVQEIVYALSFIHTHTDIRMEYGKNITKKVKHEFGLQKMLNSLEKLYVTEAPKTHSS